MNRLDDRYSLGEQIGRGGVGEVYRGMQTALERPVAIKILRQELSLKPTSVARFQREAFTTSRLNHPNIVTVYDIGRTDDDQPFVVMELLDGLTLGQRIREAGSLGVEETLEIAHQVVRGMAAGQGVGLVHRDLKPDNIFLLQEGLVKVLDFGLATLLDQGPEPEFDATEEDIDSELAPGIISPSSDETVNQAGRLTRPGALLGTPRYMAPEQVLGWEVDHRTDLYAFGVILFESLCGRTPFTGQDVQTIMSHHLHSSPEPLSTACPKAPRALCQIVDRLLAKDPSDRFEDWTALATSLRPLLRISSSKHKTNQGANTELARPKEPFRFLHPFNEASSQIFFGRERDTQRFQDAWQHSDRTPMVVVCGASGVGKSSFLGARICPYLEESGHQIIRIAGTPSPLSQVRKVALDRLAREGIRDENQSLYETLDQLVQRLGGGLAIVLDQLEEMFTTGSPQQQANFQAEISSLVLGGQSQIRLVLSLREDYLGQLIRTLYPIPLDRISRTLALRPLEREDITEALVGPGRTSLDVDYPPFSWERGLVDEIVMDLLADSASEVAPRIQAVGARLWDMVRDTPLPHKISRSHYRHRLSGARGILARLLDEAILAQPKEEQDAAKALLRALTHLPGSPTSRPAPESILVSYTEMRGRRSGILKRLESPWRVIHGYTDPRWPEERTYRIAHEALVHRIQQYGDEASELNRARQLFAHGLSLWLQGGRDDGDLLPSAHFDLVQRHIDSLVIHTPDEAAYYEACVQVLNAGWLEVQRVEKRGRLRNRMLIFVVPLVAIGLGVFLGQAPVEFSSWNSLQAQALGRLGTQKAHLKDRSFVGSELMGLDLVAVNFDRSDLRMADLSGSRMPSASLVGTRLEGAVLKNVDLRGANLTDARIEYADFSGADLSSATMDLETQQANFLGARFNLGTTWRDGPPPGALGPNGDVHEADLRDLDLSTGADEDAVVNMQGLNAVQARFENSNLSGVRLDHADLSRSSLRNAYLSGAYLEEAMLDGADLSGADLSGANLQFASLKGADLQGADLTAAILRGADLSGANLCGAQLSSAKLEGAIWTDSTTCP